MANKRLNATITIGGAVASSLRSAFGDIKGQVGQVGAALRRLETEQRTLTSAIRTFGEAGKNVDGLRARYAILTGQVDKLRVAHERLRRVEAAQQANAAKRAEYRGQIMDAVALGATAGAPLVMAARFENAMLGVAKQVDGARDSSGRLTAVYHQMAREIQQLGREIPLATNDLADMVAAGARMGVARDQLLGFTRTAAMMAEAFELPAGELADQMGKIAGLYKIPIPAIGELADAVNYLDDNAISKGGDIIDFLTRTGGVASSVKITGKEMAALGSTLLTLGERTETAGTAVNAMFSKFAAAESGTKDLREAFKLIGVSAAEVQKGMQRDSIGTIMKVMAAIAKMPKDRQLGIMVDLVGLEHSDTLAKLANNTDEFRRQLKLANDEANKGSMGREFSARLATTNAQWQLMKNRVEEVAVNIGSVLLPALNATFGAIAPVVSAVADFAREHPKLTQAVVGTTVALVGLRLATLAGGYALTFLKGGALQVAGALAGARAQMLLASISSRALGASAVTARGGLLGLATGALPAVVGGIRAVTLALVTNPIGAIVAGIAFAGLMIYRHWDGVKAFMVGTFDGITAGLQPVVQTFREFWQALEPLHPAFALVGDGLKTAWEWFTNLLQPVKYSTEELGKAGAAGRTFGEALAAGINLVLMPLQTLIQGLTWVANNIGGIAAKAVEFKNAAGNAIGGAWDKTKAFFGGDDAAPANGAPAAPSLPTPAMATARGQGGTTVNDNSQTTIQVTQQPGQNTRELAREITRLQEQERAVRRRGAMIDGAPAQ